MVPPSQRSQELSIALTTTPPRSVDRLVDVPYAYLSPAFHGLVSMFRSRALTRVSAPILIPIPQLYNRPCYGSLLAQRLLVTFAEHILHF